MKMQDVRIGKKLFTIIDNRVIIIDILNVINYGHRRYVEYIDISELGNIECVGMFICCSQLKEFWVTPKALKNKL